MSDFTIREAKREDAPVILDMIKALAVYEKAADQVVCTEADILRDGFGEHPIFHCLLAESERAGEAAVGIALYFYKWSTWTGTRSLHLEDLFVIPEARGRGIGLSLLKRLAQVAVEEGCPRMDWEVLDWNTDAQAFYRAIGAAHRSDWYPFRIENEALRALARQA